jgi:long-subunit acyl-CoA synthetase (AMP-forming)
MVVLAEAIRPKLTDPQVRSDVESQLGQLLKDVNQQLAEYEHLRMLVVISDPWSIENGQLTPTMKIRRGRIEAAVAPQVEAWYKASGTVFWA